MGGDLIMAIDGQEVQDTTDISRVNEPAPRRRQGHRHHLPRKQKMDVPVVLDELPQERN